MAEAFAFIMLIVCEKGFIIAANLAVNNGLCLLTRRMRTGRRQLGHEIFWLAQFKAEVNLLKMVEERRQ